MCLCCISTELLQVVIARGKHGIAGAVRSVGLMRHLGFPSSRPGRALNWRCGATRPRVLTAVCVGGAYRPASDAFHPGRESLACDPVGRDERAVPAPLVGGSPRSAGLLVMPRLERQGVLLLVPGPRQLSPPPCPEVWTSAGSVPTHTPYSHLPQLPNTVACSSRPGVVLSWQSLRVMLPYARAATWLPRRA